MTREEILSAPIVRPPVWGTWEEFGNCTPTVQRILMYFEKLGVFNGNNPMFPLWRRCVEIYLASPNHEWKGWPNVSDELGLMILDHMLRQMSGDLKEIRDALGLGWKG